MKKCLIILLLSSCILSCSHLQNREWIPFTWESATFSGKYFEKAAMIIPITIDDLPQKFNMQFDLGATSGSGFYENPLVPFLKEYPSLNRENVNMRLGEVVFEGVSIGLYENYGEVVSLDSIDSKREIHIGTIGADFVQNKILIIDYKLNRLAIVETMPYEYQKVSFENIEKDSRGRIKIPFLINGKTEHLMFDTGSSIFSLIASKQNAIAIGGNEIVDTLTGSSWGKPMTVYGLKTAVPIMLGDKNLGNTIVYYFDDTSWDDFYISEKIWGITGNVYFLDKVVIIDYKNNRFGVK